MGGSYSCLSSIFNCATPTSINGHIVMKSLVDRNSLRANEERIERSKIHWSQLSQSNELSQSSEVVEVSNMEVFQNLQSDPKWGTFFQTFGNDGVGELNMGLKFAEGGQAELYDVNIHWYDPRKNEEDLRYGLRWVLKVFKKGTRLSQLRLQWPHGMLQTYVDRLESECCGNLPPVRSTSDVYCGTLLEDGRFAFVMVKEHEDLQDQINRLMLKRRKNHCPYSKHDVECIMFKVAIGMEWLHRRGIVHRDLKAANVLYTKLVGGGSCGVADYECSIGVIGTGFFRAPEILQACKDYSINDKPELFTKEADVYSYGMVCYEILTGRLPFDDYSLHDYDHVLAGERPKVPEYVDGWIQELLKMCWQANPSDRPSFRGILDYTMLIYELFFIKKLN